VDLHRSNGQNLETLPSSSRDIEACNTDESRPLSVRGVRRRMPLTRNELLGDMRNVLYGHWIGRGPKTFSYTTCIVGFVLLIGAFQFVLGAWDGMIESGDRDRCYYNDFCYRVSDYDIPFNLMISNLVYMIHGIILAFSVLWIEAVSHLHAANGNDAVSLNAEAYKGEQSFSIGYSFAWALAFQGCFSMVYHFCPKQLTFQFDSAFMFVISGLIVLSLSLQQWNVQGKVQLPIHSNTFYLFFIVPLLVLNYFGALYSSDKIIFGVEIFTICLMGYYLILISWAGMKLFWNVRGSHFRHRNVKMNFGFFIALLILVVIVVLIVQRGNYPQILLWGCIFAALLAICSKVIVPFCRSALNRRRKRNDAAIHFLQFLYVVVTFVTMITAAVIYHFKAATDKEKSPSESRDLNHDCVLLGFFDYHDLWHILSSFSLLMVAYFVLYFSK